MKKFLKLLFTVSIVSIITPIYAQLPAANPLFCIGIVPVQGGFAMAEKGSRSLDFYTSDFKQKTASIKFEDQPTGLTNKGDILYITTFGTQGKLHVIQGGKIVKTIDVGHSPTAPVASNDASKVYVMNQFQNRVSEIDPANGTILRTVNVVREPKGAVQSKDGKSLFVTNYLPAQRADLDYVAADVSIINLANFTVEKNIKLANGSNALRGITITDDGKYVLVSHNLGRFTVPTSQLQQGWMNTSAMSVIDATTHNYVGAVVLDDPDRGAAGIWGIQTTAEKIIVTHSGTHDISVIDYPKFITKLATYKNSVEALSYDLRFMYGIRKRVPLNGNGPRDLMINEDKVYIPTYFSDTLNIYSLTDDQVSYVALNPGRQETLAQRGERIFNDASYCFQNWQSCNGCHPGEARTDGMNWDLMNDGIGNSKNCKSLLLSIPTPPAMISGIRESAILANRTGFKHIQFYEISEQMATCVDAYTKSLTPVSSPYLVNGELSDKAKLGKKVFEKLGCDECHSGIYYTDMKMHRIGKDIEFDAGWDTPTLREVWRTAPYLFDGRAATMRDVFEEHKHGIEKKVSQREIDELVEYVNSL